MQVVAVGTTPPSVTYKGTNMLIVGNKDIHSRHAGRQCHCLITYLFRLKTNYLADTEVAYNHPKSSLHADTSPAGRDVPGGCKSPTPLKQPA